MFFGLFGSEHHNANSKKVNCQGYFGMLLNLSPCLCHFLRPMYVVKNKHRVVVRLVQAPFKVLQSGLSTMIAVKNTRSNCGICVSKSGNATSNCPMI